MTNLDTREGLAAAQADYLARKAADPAGFMRHRPEFGKDGFDIDTGRVFETGVRAAFGDWPESDLDQEDGDLALLRAIHTRAKTQWRDMIGTLQSVRADDDPSLNADGRLKIAARILEPKIADVEALAEREIARVAQSIEHEEAEIAKATREADALEVAGHHSIREHFKALDDARRGSELRRAIEARDRLTLQALATMPAYLSGLSPEGHTRAREALGEIMAPDRTRRVAALRGGVLMADRAVKEYAKRTRSLIDFNRARQLIELEAQRAAR